MQVPGLIEVKSPSPRAPPKKSKWMLAFEVVVVMIVFFVLGFLVMHIHH